MLEANEDRKRQIERIATSSVLRGSESLCRLLRYLARQALENPGTPVREFQIATEVFGRPAEFDPRLDSTVRVQTGRLRAKLAEYYRVIGASDSTGVEIPKGTYQLAFQTRQVSVPAPAEPAVAQGETARPLTGPRKRTWMVAFAGMTGIALLLAVLLIFRPVPRAVRASASPGESLERFWSGLLETPSHPIVAFHSGDAATMAVHELDTVFGSLGHTVPVKPVAMLSEPDLESGDVIFVGPPPDNLGLRGFHFQTVGSGAHKGEVAILNLYPMPGEPAQWMPVGPPLTEDYAVVSLEPGSLTGRWLLTLAGTSSFGTQAAAEFVCHEDSMKTLLQKTGRGRFEALIHTNVRNGAPSDTQLVVVHSAE